jgi:hypothetical protein
VAVQLLFEPNASIGEQSRANPGGNADGEEKDAPYTARSLYFHSAVKRTAARKANSAGGALWHLKALRGTDICVASYSSAQEPLQKKEETASTGRGIR